ncbi:putative MarR family transcription regulator [Sphingomonas sp. SORGH_AS 950]|uniref:winged helix DNA-binding protein n=1 Tax=unclassified Sphingomonas TaxID=196159 RepID=UPI0027842F86|nr:MULTISPECIES: winged helix DNA-binding protein [unclassified Sphingomonas]MDQ1159163.1 putative MarR family transcription regulator [Sphingomonas sp. SORGH_AS_0950]MDR6113193.1 putative MarR family transcription regulator [Sphingomonas sp. SORGH_AS_0789]MDR6145695.1 putative MarR family transcription regulator [Sphingomonas sp. SORGH_AS_0870]MDR6149446.1 putative MarR family transcription regulator [Sphingomonas sp. SORGH_AS_0742]
MTNDKRAIVSSAHLADGAAPALSELEFSLTLAAAAYQRWIVRCAAAAGLALAPLEVLILHTVRHRDRAKRIADIALVLDVEDTHLITYAIRKLERAGLVATDRSGKEKRIAATEAGRDFCLHYRDIRERVLASAVVADGPDGQALSEAADLLRSLSGQYNQAARAAATL